MNEDPTQPPPSPSFSTPAAPEIPPLPPPVTQAPIRERSRFDFSPLPAILGPTAVVDALLKTSGRLIHGLHAAGAGRLGLVLAVVTALCLALDGLVVGSFAGGTQLWAAPVKILVGSALTGAICLPSFYVFACLSGAEVRFGPLCGVLLAAGCLESLLLLSFAPVAWVFSQSTDSVAFIGTLHLLFWFIAALFAARLLGVSAEFVRARDRGYLRIWLVICALVSLQMMTALRPIVGRSAEGALLPREKIFFLQHWLRLWQSSPRGS